MMKYLIIIGLLFSFAYATDINSCESINVPGNYVLTTNLNGSGITAGPQLSGNTCVRINSSDVVLDCNNYAITVNGTIDTYGIIVYASNSSRISNITTKNCLISNVSIGIYSANSSSIILMNNTLSNGIFSNYGIWAAQTRNSVIRNNVINNISNAIYLSGSEYISVTENSMDNTQNAILMISGNNSITYNNITNVLSRAIIVGGILQDGGNSLVSNNIINGFGGIISQFSTFVNITNNTIVNVSTEGIYLYVTSNALVENNTVKSDNLGIRLDTSNNLTASGNFISDSPIGILVFGENMTVSSNIISNISSSGTGIYSTAASNLVITNNTFSYGDINSVAVFFDNVINSVLSNNIVYNFTGYGLRIENLGGFDTITGNTIFNTTTGIVSNTHDNTISNNVIYSTTQYGIIDSSLNDNIQHNTLYNNILSIYVLGSIGVESSTNVSYNTVYNSDQGIIVQLASNNLISNNALYNNNVSLYFSSAYNETAYLNNIHDSTDGLNTSFSDNFVISANTIYRNINGISYHDTTNITEMTTHYYNNSNDTLILNSNVHGQDVVYDAANGTLNTYARIAYFSPVTSLSINYADNVFNASIFQHVISGMLEINNISGLAQLNSLGFYVSPSSLPPNLNLINIQLIKYDVSPLPLPVTYDIANSYVNTVTINSFSLFYTASYPPVTANVTSRNYTWTNFETYITNFYGDYDDLIYVVLSLAFGFLLTTKLPNQLAVSFICLTISYMLTLNIIFISAAVLALIAWLVYKYVVG